MHGGFAEDAQTARHSRVAGLHLTSSRRREDGLSNADKLAHYVFLISEINVNVYSEEARQMIPPHPPAGLRRSRPQCLARLHVVHLLLFYCSDEHIAEQQGGCSAPVGDYREGRSDSESGCGC